MIDYWLKKNKTKKNNMKKIYDKFEHKYVKMSDNDIEAIKSSTYLLRRYDYKKIKIIKEAKK